MHATLLSIRAVSPPSLDSGLQVIARNVAMTARGERMLIFFMTRKYRLFCSGTLENSKFRVDKALQQCTFRG
jgi:hypothetical protein